MKILSMNFTNLWNSEHPLVVNRIAQIVQSQNPPALHLEKAYGRLAALLPAVNTIAVQEKRNVLSAVLSELDNERDALLGVLISQSRTLSRVNLPSTTQAAVLIDALFDKHGRDMAQANYTSETQRISGLLTDLQLSENAAAIATLNLGQVVDRLFLVNSEFASRFMERNANEAAMPMVDVRAIRHEADAAIHFLFKAIEFCASEYDNLDYTPLISQINELVAYYKAQIKARQSRRQSGANVSTEPPIATV